MKFLFLLVCLLPYAIAGDIIAINVALTPDKKLEEHVKAMNSDANRENPKSFLFDETHFPHLTLFQGYVDKDDLPAIKKITDNLGVEKIPVETDGIYMTDLKGSPTNKLFNLRFEKSLELARLQSKVVAAMKPFLKTNPDKNAFYQSKTVQKEFVNYAADYVTKEFEPHMTVGVLHSPGRTKDPEGKKFELDNIEVFQLGEFGSARKKL